MIRVHGGTSEATHHPILLQSLIRCTVFETATASNTLGRYTDRFRFFEFAAKVEARAPRWCILFHVNNKFNKTSTHARHNHHDHHYRRLTYRGRGIRPFEPGVLLHYTPELSLHRPSPSTAYTVAVCTFPSTSHPTNPSFR